MPSNTYSGFIDKSMQNRVPGEGMPVRINWMCGHRSPNTGGTWRGLGKSKVPWKCAACSGAEVKA